jgi:dUTP pyrophosphatase
MSSGAVGFDLHADIDLPTSLRPGERRSFSVGFKMALPLGYEAQIRSRSGLAFDHGIVVLNAPGTIDSDYRGVVSVMLINLSGAAYLVRPGARIAQMVIAPVAPASMVVVESLDDTERGAGGFGSTGE